MKLVKFQNLLEDNPDVEDISFGILLENNTILCLCCLGIFEEDDYDIIDEYDISAAGIIEHLKEIFKYDNGN